MRKKIRQFWNKNGTHYILCIRMYDVHNTGAIYSTVSFRECKQTLSDTHLQKLISILVCPAVVPLLFCTGPTTKSEIRNCVRKSLNSISVLKTHFIFVIIIVNTITAGCSAYLSYRGLIKLWCYCNLLFYT